MRTTVTLDKDVERLLQAAMRRTGGSFKQTLNEAIRAGLAGRSAREKPAKFVLKARPLGLRPGVDPTSLNKLVDELEINDFLARTRRARKA